MVCSLQGGLPSARPSRACGVGVREVGGWGGGRGRAERTQRAEENRLRRPLCFAIPHGSFPFLPFHFITADKCDLLVSQNDWISKEQGPGGSSEPNSQPRSGFRSLFSSIFPSSPGAHKRGFRSPAIPGLHSDSASQHLSYPGQVSHLAFQSPSLIC